ncbi:lysozyme [Paraburkholderia sp. BL10I2N1]|uniref:lysozyme n=1 Tax=Paraburkholderia sp. BL10I2N1 TaxID=1938796 RepID=UPI00105C3B20|nr:lysozyme [Paraburkholderia sp. BL10I2N1]TDN62569.1 lysozyme [Paraburkholderia sp. BL10I2N1]
MPDALATAVTNTSPNSSVNVQTGRLSKPWFVSNDGLSFIAVWESGTLNGIYGGHKVIEGFILMAYRDNVGIPTVGCGHRILPSDHINVGDTISLERARNLKKKAIEQVEKRLNSDIKVPLYQYEYDALVSIVYNCGAGDGAKEIIKKINSEHYKEMPDYILHYRVGTNKGVGNRRVAESRLFKSGVYDASH